jgi:phytoene dehydrogenase-like protein
MGEAVVIGAGHNGLVAAFYLARAGVDVTVVEGSDRVGGACKTEELIPGYRFSTCANYLAWLRPKVAADMRLFERGVTVEGGPAARILDGDRPFVWWPEPDRVKLQIATFSRRDAAQWDAWTRIWRDAASLLGPHLLSYPPTLRELTGHARRERLGGLLETVLSTSLAELVDEFFESAELRGSIGPPHDVGSVTERGSALMQALAAAMETYTETGMSAPQGYVRGGMGTLTEAMRAAAEEAGAAVLTNCPVERIAVEDGRAVGVRLADGRTLPARLVVANSDPKRTFLSLIDPVALPSAFLRRVRGLRTDVAPLKLHCAMNGLPRWHAFDDADLPNRGPLALTSSRAVHERAWADARSGCLPSECLIVAMTPSIWDPALAPPGHHTTSFWIQFAPVRPSKGSWNERREEMADRLLNQIASRSPNFRERLHDYVLLTPADLERRVSLTDGNIHHVDISPGQALWQRPLTELARYRSPVEGLYLCGAGQHPYGEVSGGPGHNSAHAVLEDLGLIGAGTWEETRPGATGHVAPKRAPSFS